MPHERHEDYMKRRMREEGTTATEYNNLRLTQEIEDLKLKIKKLETDMAYTQKVRSAQSPEEQRIYNLKN